MESLMGQMKALLMDFCELVYDDEVRQTQLAKDMIESHTRGTATTIEQFRKVYEDTGVVPQMKLKTIHELVQNARLNGSVELK